MATTRRANGQGDHEGSQGDDEGDEGDEGGTIDPPVEREACR